MLKRFFRRLDGLNARYGTLTFEQQLLTLIGLLAPGLFLNGFDSPILSLCGMTWLIGLGFLRIDWVERQHFLASAPSDLGVRVETKA